MHAKHTRPVVLQRARTVEGATIEGVTGIGVAKVIHAVDRLTSRQTEQQPHRRQAHPRQVPPAVVVHATTAHISHRIRGRKKAMMTTCTLPRSTHNPTTKGTTGRGMSNGRNRANDSGNSHGNRPHSRRRRHRRGPRRQCQRRSNLNRPNRLLNGYHRGGAPLSKLMRAATKHITGQGV